MEIAITRQVSRSIADCELTFLSREPIDLERARRQHALYEAVLRQFGLAVLSLPEEPGLPDAVFVEDLALVLEECALITRPGAPSRGAEEASIAQILSHFRDLVRIHPPACVDGGDILRLGKRIYVGLTQRTDSAAVDQIRDLLAPRGYEIRPVPVTGCLHLKSAATEISTDVLLVNPAWVDREVFKNVKTVEIDPSEPYAANALRLGNTVVCGAAFPRTRQRLDRAGIRTVAVEVDELAKAEGALTCCSLIVSI